MLRLIVLKIKKRKWKRDLGSSSLGSNLSSPTTTKLETLKHLRNTHIHTQRGESGADGGDGDAIVAAASDG